MGKEAKTNAMRILEREKIPYTARFYQEDQGPEGTREYGVHIAETLGQDPARVFKTLVTQGADRNFYVFVIPVLAIWLRPVCLLRWYFSFPTKVGCLATTQCWQWL